MGNSFMGNSWRKGQARVYKHLAEEKLEKLRREYEKEAEEIKLVYGIISECFDKGIAKIEMDPDQVKADLQKVNPKLDGPSKFLVMMEYYREKGGNEL